MSAEGDYTRMSPLQGAGRLDKFLAQAFPHLSRVLLQQAIRDGGVRVDGVLCTRAAQRLTPRCEVALNRQLLAALQPDAAAACAAEEIALDIVYEDDTLLVLNKPPGQVVHPGHGNRSGTLQNGLLHHHAAAANLVRAGIVHRLDKDTSGLLAVAKTPLAQRHLIAQFKARQIGREYLALVHGSPPPTGVICQPLRRDRQQPTRMAVAAGGKVAETRYVRQRQWRGFALLACTLHTGRTHQIRVHLEHSGYPVVGDQTYRRRATPLPLPCARQLLHATTLRLLHPRTKVPCCWHCPPPPDMLAVLDVLDELAQPGGGGAEKPR